MHIFAWDSVLAQRSDKSSAWFFPPSLVKIQETNNPAIPNFDISVFCLLEFTYGQLASYGGGAGRGGGSPNDFGGGGGDYDSGGSLEETIPGTPGVDYPILAEVPDTGFSCDGQVTHFVGIILYRFSFQAEGGKYADPDAQCQVFHFCALGDTEGGLITYSFLCPNGTIFNQESEESLKFVKSLLFPISAKFCL